MITARRRTVQRASSGLFASSNKHACRNYASTTQLVGSLPQQGESIHGFTLKRTKHVPELELTALHFEHDKTGGQYVHLAKDDKNNVFTIGFKTNPPDHTGVPHILEHITLCGSDKYPVRDPFFKMMPRSLNNFMNAMTYPDHTVYPFATTNHQDFRNLMAVYLDATLHPMLRAHDFAQEGWRVGPTDPRAPVSENNKLDFKGVVYNEMKGQMSNADYLYYVRWMAHIFPDMQHSGGDPQKMTDLTHAQLKQFHADHYNPSNAKVFTYGNIPYVEHLKQLGTELDKFGKSNVDSHLMIPTTIDSPQTVTVKGPADPLYPKEEQYKASVSWLMNDTSDVLETFSLDIISALLLDGFSAPLYQNTIGVGWGASYSPNTGYDSSAKTGIFSVGLSGLKVHDVSRLRDGIENTLLSVRRKGFDKEKIEGQLHQVELALKHKSAKFGMSLASRLQNGWFNGVDPFKTVDPEEVLAAFRHKIQDSSYLMDLFDKYWLHKNNFTFIMEPSEEFGEEGVAEEASRLSSKIADVTKQHSNDSEAANRALEQQEKELLEVQESAQNADVSCLPTIHVSDITRSVERKEIRHSSIGETKVQWRETPTNGLTYFRAVQTFKDLPDELRLYLPLFSSAIQRLGSSALPVEALEDQIRLRTGGLALSTHSSTSPLDMDMCEDGIAVSGTALDRNVPHMLELLRIIVQETDFNKRDAGDKLTELIKSAASSAVNDIADSGHAYARRFAEAGISPEGRLNEQSDGLTQMRLMMDLAARAGREPLTDVVEKLKAIQGFVLSGASSMRVALTCGADASSSNEAALRDFLERLPTQYQAPQSPDQLAYPRDSKSFFPLPYQVYYTGLAMRTVPYADAASAPLAILAQLLTHRRLHPEVREKGGAYGASAYSAALRGTFGFATYRDPNPLNSLKVMGEAGAWAAQRQWEDREIEEAKLSVFQGIDAPKSASQEGMTLFLTGITDEMRQARRERLLDVSSSDVRDAAEKHLVKEVNAGRSNAAILGKKADWAGVEAGWIEVPMGAGEGAQQPTGEGERDESGYLVL